MLTAGGLAMLWPSSLPVDDRRLVVQFIHPGGEHQPDTPTGMQWNSASHARKFLIAPGQCQRLDQTHSGQLTFWGEWEPPSTVLAVLEHPASSSPWDRFPSYLMKPELAYPESYHGLQNTDPCVFGGFFYTGCQQRPTNSLRWLASGSVILFGSRVGGPHTESAFLLDTVLVVRDCIDHNAESFRRVLRGKVPDPYYAVTLEPWYADGIGGSPEDVGYRLYQGATLETPVNGMFSFFPALPSDGNPRGFARPRIRHADVSDKKPQGFKQTRVTLDEAALFWRAVRDQVISADLWLGTSALMPA
jgi:hypothetical protein